MNHDHFVFNLIKAEADRQRNGLELIPSENYVSSDVLSAMGFSVSFSLGSICCCCYYFLYHSHVWPYHLSNVLKSNIKCSDLLRLFSIMFVCLKRRLCLILYI